VHTRRVVFGLVVATVSVLGAAPALASGWAGSTMSVKPSSLLVEGQTVKVKATGLRGFSLDPGRTVVMVECPADAADSTSCGYVNGNGPSTGQSATVTSGGTLNARYDVTARFWSEWQHVDCTQPPGCTIGLVDPISGYLGPVVPISFAPGA
jgi:hypothetical protein